MATPSRHGIKGTLTRSLHSLLEPMQPQSFTLLHSRAIALVAD